MNLCKHLILTTKQIVKLTQRKIRTYLFSHDSSFIRPWTIVSVIVSGLYVVIINSNDTITDRVLRNRNLIFKIVR